MVCDCTGSVGIHTEVRSGLTGKFPEKVEINTPGELIYQPVKAAVSDQGGF
jgi:hypothetical protein